MSPRYMKNVVTLSLEPSTCRGCAICVDVCPHRVFAMDGKMAVIRDRDACMECGACARNCAFGAIRVRAGVGCAAAILSSKGNLDNCCCG